MSALSLLGNLEPQQPTTAPLTSVPSTIGERMDASWAATQTNDRFRDVTAARRDKAQKVIDDYHALTGEKLRNPFDNAPTMDEVRENLGQPTTAIYAKRLQTLKEKTAAARAGLPDLGGLPQDFLSVDDIDAEIGQESGAARARNERLRDTGNGIPAFIAEMAGEMTQPHNILGAFLPVTRLPLVAAEGIGARWMANVGREALLQGVSQGAVQAAGSVVDYNTRKAFGTEQTHEQLIEEILAAAAGGAVLGGGFRAAHLGIRSLMNHGVTVPPAVRDASIAMESQALYGNKNVLGVQVATHEAALDKAVADIAYARPVSTADLPTVPMRPQNIFDEPLPNIARGLTEPRPSPTYGRGEGVQYHGSSQPELAPIGDHYSSRNYYGQGFYTTDAQDVAYGYSKRGSDATGERNVYRVDEREGLSLYNAEQPMTPEVAAAIGRVHDFNGEPISDLLRDAKRDGRDLNLRQLYDEIRDYGTSDGNSADVIQETFDSINAQLRTLGYDGMTHEGGLKTGAASHKVAIYFNPESDVSLTRVTEAPEIQKLRKWTEEPKTTEEAPATFTPPDEETAARSTSEAASPQDKSMDAQVRELVAEGGAAPRYQKEALEKLAQEEKEARIAVSCVGGGAL